MFEFDEEKVANRLIAEKLYVSREIALQDVRSMQNLHENLRLAFLTWLDGGTPKFEYEGFTLEGLKELINPNLATYYQAIDHMDTILKNPEKEIPFYRNKNNFRILCDLLHTV